MDVATEWQRLSWRRGSRRCRSARVVFGPLADESGVVRCTSSASRSHNPLGNGTVGEARRGEEVLLRGWNAVSSADNTTNERPEEPRRRARRCAIVLPGDVIGSAVSISRRTSEERRIS